MRRVVFLDAMQSPKFANKVNHLKKIVSASLLSTLWKKKNGVRDHMRKQIVPDAVEFLDFHIQHRQRCNSLEALICSGNYLPSPILRMRFEKSKGLCRQVALPSPDEALILQALSNSLWREIEPKAPSNKAFFAPQDQPFAKRNPVQEDDEWGYGPIESWLDFQQEILKFSQARNFVVVTDIANYYDCIIHGFLRNILSNYDLQNEFSLDLLLFILDAMLWRPDYMPNFGIGLPQMNLDAPRLLAHTHLFEIDALFSKRTDVDYARYMDDMDFGVDTEAKAKVILRDLDLALHTRNIRLNSGKTKILTALQAARYFRVAENSRLTVLMDKMRQTIYLERRERVFKKLVSKLIDRGITDKAFDDGNGGKVLKRLLGLAARLGSPLGDHSLRMILYNVPALREAALKASIRSCAYPRQIDIITGFLGSGQAVDDYSRVLIATTLASAVYPVALPYLSLFELLYQLREDDPFVLYSRLWLISRFDTRSRLWDEIKKTRSVWSRHSFLCRLVAGFSGLLRQSAYFTDFENEVRRWSGPEGLSVLDLHESVATTVTGFETIRQFIEAGNPSIPTNLSHPKSLLLASAIWNKTIKKARRSKLLGLHSVAMQDTYYRQIFSYIISNAA